MFQALPEFLNASQYQDYPFYPGFSSLSYSGLQLCREWVLDVGLVYDVSSEYEYQVPAYLSSITSNGTTVVFTFNATTLAIQFSVPATAAFGYTANTTAANVFGFIQTGDLSYFATHTGTWTGTTAYLELGRVQTLYKHYVNSFNTANKVTTQSPSTCTSSIIPFETVEIEGCLRAVPLVVDDTGTVGHIALKAGYHTAITVDHNARIITVTPSTDMFISTELPCETLRIPADSLVLGPECKDLLYAINGIMGDPVTGNFSISGEHGIFINPSTSLEHTVEITIDSTNLYRERHYATCDSTSSLLPQSMLPADGYDTYAIREMSGIAHASPAVGALTLVEYAPAGDYRLYYVYGAVSVGGTDPTRVWNGTDGVTSPLRYKYVAGGTMVEGTWPKHDVYSSYQEASDNYTGSFVDFSHEGGPIYAFVSDTDQSDNAGMIVWELRYRT